jgi:CBS domain-containing protein
MKNLWSSKEVNGIFVSILFLGLGFMVIWATQAMLISAGDAVFVSLLLIPLLAYIIVSGRVSEFKAPGGLEVKLVTMARQPANNMATENIEMLGEAISVVRKSGLEELDALESRLDESQRILLKLVLGQHYELETLTEYVDRLLRYKTFKFVIFLDQKHRLLAYASSWAIARILQGNQAHRLLDMIAQEKVMELWDFPGMMTRTLSTRENAIDALKIMNTANLEAVPIVDDKQKVKAIIERERILCELFLGMTTGS